MKTFSSNKIKRGLAVLLSDIYDTNGAITALNTLRTNKLTPSWFTAFHLRKRTQLSSGPSFGELRERTLPRHHPHRRLDQEIPGHLLKLPQHRRTILPFQSH
ncbi:MAG: hypothetical protein M2R45_03104 [Verrucomicrobia subdivision 3 bacterium]|nr:hypothetical protein [Limisphaerales bacterium]MCS1413172.1 hypothetical protein [Limisphaerales bacterium]